MTDDTAVRIAAARVLRGDAPGALRLLTRQAAEVVYACCEHIGKDGCPDSCTGHLAPCTACRQPLIRTADQQAARDMAAGR